MGSLTAERWVERRTKFTRSLAVMSMVGYILGLGDRHLSNLMLDQLSGEVVHIDFGDCFEVAIHREKCPETVPFRLTRMFVKAMGVSGVEGTFRSTCEAVMGVLHRHKDSVMAMLEAFLHDPLLDWRLATDEDDEQSADASAAGKDDAPSGLTVEEAARVDRNVDSVIVERRVAVGREVADVDESKMNARAMEVLDRVQSKLVGTDAPPEPLPMAFPNWPTDEDLDVDDGEQGALHDSLASAQDAMSFGSTPPASPAIQPRPLQRSLEVSALDVREQVDRLIAEAQSHTNLVQLYWGWNPFW
jgi:FKBP12-rapamycin complex-associated protein